MKKHIPNLITLLNLFSGLIAIIFAANNNLILAAFFVLLGILFDFFDGFFARVLNVQAKLGKQLDSLADMVTSGVVPGLIMYKLLENSQENSVNFSKFSFTVASWISTDSKTIYFIPFFGFLITLAAAYRLAVFNLDEKQSSSFIGLPTPAMTLVIISLPLILTYSNNIVALNLIKNIYVLIAITIIGSFLMNANLKLFSLKFKNFKFKDNTFVYLFLLLSIILLITLKFIAIPMIIIVYILLSIIQNLMAKH